jgi:Ca2+-binding EF-hand superfamily protein
MFAMVVGWSLSLSKDADRDRDGILARQEFEVMARQDRLFTTIGFAYFDAKGDGRITLPELADKPNRAFALFDKNGECAISFNDRLNLESKRQDESRRVLDPIPRSGHPGGY